MANATKKWFPCLEDAILSTAAISYTALCTWHQGAALVKLLLMMAI